MTLNVALRPAAVRPLPAPSTERSITDAEYALYHALVLRESGINLDCLRRPFLATRLGVRIRHLRLRSFYEYYRVVRYDARERTMMIDLLTGGERSFFREPEQFDRLERKIVPAWKRAAEAGTRPRSLRVWSAGCGTGEEPYSVAMLLDALCEGWEIEVLATDISPRALALAAEAMWPQEKARQIPSHYYRRSMVEESGALAGRMRVADSIRRHVRFARLNLQEEGWSLGGPFDLILCRNVLSYFGAEARLHVVERLVQRCQRGGYLFLGNADVLSEAPKGVRAVEPAVWIRR